IPGDDLVLTVDRSLQYQVEQALLAGINKPTVMAKGASAVILDSSTGEVLAMANVDRDKAGNAKVTAANNAAVAAHEPGSVAKVFSISASVNEGIASPDTTINVPPYIIFGEGTPYQHIVRDAESHDTGPMTLRQILVQSSNIGTWLTAKQLGSQKLAAYLTAFGFGSTTALDFPGESAGLIKPWQNWQGTENATVTYGYGYSATALQLVSAVNTIANGGIYVAPKLVKAVVDSSGKMVSTPPSASHQVVTAATAQQMTSMMTDVVCSKKGTGYLAQIPGMTVAGKTGTAYKVQAGGGYQSADGQRAYFATFVGFFPATNPKVTILVSVDEPDPTSNDRFGGTASAPIFVDLAQAAIHELQISPAPGDHGCPAPTR
ncbi:MAG: penicillin-binding protein 2, partial [Ilumatobacteraceae bacterium]